MAQLLYPSTQEAIQSYLKDIRENLDNFEQQLPNLSQRGYEEVIKNWLIKTYVNSRFLVEDLEIAALHN